MFFFGRDSTAYTKPSGICDKLHRIVNISTRCTLYFSLRASAAWLCNALSRSAFLPCTVAHAVAVVRCCGRDTRPAFALGRTVTQNILAFWVTFPGAGVYWIGCTTP